MRELQNLNNGVFVQASGDERFEVLSPVTEKAIAMSPVSTVADVDRADAAVELALAGERRALRTVGFHLDKGSRHRKDLSMYGFGDYTRIKHVMHYMGE